MRKLFIFIAGVLLLASCNNDKEVDIVYQLNAKIDILDVVKDLKDIQNADAFPNGIINEEYNVRVNFIIYDEKGTAVEQDTKIVNDFSQILNITKSLSKGEYTIVATTDIVKNNGDRVDFEFWKLENTSSLRDFKIKDLNYIGYRYKVLGIYKDIISVNGSVNLDVSVKPAGSLITMWFRNAYVNNIAYIYYEWNKSSDYYLVNEDKPNVLTQKTYDDFEVESSYTGYYDQRYLLPVQDFKFTWATLNSANVILKTNSATLNIIKAVNSNITVDVSTGDTQVSNASKTRISADEQNQGLLIKTQLALPTSQSLDISTLPLVK